MGSRRRFLAAVLFSAACSTAHADRPIASPPPTAGQIALGIAPAPLRAPYDVQIMRSNGETLPTFGLRDRFYVQGNANERYIIRITNPTSRRIEAVVSVDGLDVIDGENGDLRKRGYVVPAYGETRIEGFRTSQEDVATFRFSSVSGSYAGQKGKARNVGVIAVALFEEQAPPPEQQIVGELAPPPPRWPQHRPAYGSDDRDGGAASAPRAPRGAKAGRAETTASADAPSAAKRAPEPAPAVRPAPPPPAPSRGQGHALPVDPEGDDDRIAPPGRPEPRDERERLGLGTEFGEQRSSAVNYTQFVRAPGRPVAIAELRYNDAAGLIALGIPVRPLPDAGELMVRETADPFPGDRYAQPPR